VQNPGAFRQYPQLAGRVRSDAPQPANFGSRPLPRLRLPRNHRARALRLPVGTASWHWIAHPPRGPAESVARAEVQRACLCVELDRRDTCWSGEWTRTVSCESPLAERASGTGHASKNQTSTTQRESRSFGTKFAETLFLCHLSGWSTAGTRHA
jgi:hypothetical protein